MMILSIKGDWKEGKKHGYGELVYTNGDKFRLDYCVTSISLIYIRLLYLVVIGKMIKHAEREF